MIFLKRWLKELWAQARINPVGKPVFFNLTVVLGDNISSAFKCILSVFKKHEMILQDVFLVLKLSAMENRCCHVVL